MKIISVPNIKWGYGLAASLTIVVLLMATMMSSPTKVSATGALYKFINLNSEKCLGVAGASKASTAKVVQYTCLPGLLDHKWELRNIAGHPDYVNIVNQNSKQCLSVAAGSTANLAHIVQWWCEPGNTNQMWYLDYAWYRPSTPRLKAYHSGKCIGIAGRSTYDAAQAVQYTCDNELDKFWQVQVQSE